MKLLALLEKARIKYQNELETFKTPEPFSRRSFIRGILFFIKYLGQALQNGDIDE
jgi:hypothetical protein